LPPHAQGRAKRKNLLTVWNHTSRLACFPHRENRWKENAILAKNDAFRPRRIKGVRIERVFIRIMDEHHQRTTILKLRQILLIE
jgi:hypothetical protein